MEGFGWLRENFEGEIAKQNIEKVKQLIPIAEDLGVSMPQLALAWCLKNPNVSTVITGASRVEQVIENMKAIDVVPRLDESVQARIEEVLQNKPDPEEDYC